MEGLATVGLVGNVPQLLQFGATVIRECRELQRSADGCLKEKAELEAVTSGLKKLIVNLKAVPAVAVQSSGRIGRKRTREEWEVE
jgi:hypothetical protein